MQLKITKNKYKGKVIEYAKIVQSYRDGKTSRQKIILNLGPIRLKNDLEKYQKILQSMKGGEEFIREKDISAENAKEFGITYTINMLLKKYEISDILKNELSKNNAAFDVYAVVKALIINRLILPSSELAAREWIQEDYTEKLDVQEHHLYRALDYLIPHKEEIEKDIFSVLKKKLKLNTDLVFCDLTSSYFEGQCCSIALFGHSRDHRKDRRQIVIALVMCDGIPIYHEVFKGNTVDKTTLKQIVEHIKRKLNIKKPIFLADAGLMTKENIEKLEIEDYDYILGCYRRNNNSSKKCMEQEAFSEKLLLKEINGKKEQYAKEVLKEHIMFNENFLFSIDFKKYIKYLRVGIITEELQELFKRNNYPLSVKSTIGVKEELKNKKWKNQWRIRDKEKNYSYSIQKNNEDKHKLNIYKERRMTNRYILCLNKNTRKERLENLKDIKKNVEKKLKELQEKFKKSQESKRKNKITKESLILQTNKILGKNKRMFNTEFEKGFVFSLKKEAWKHEKKIAGKFLLVTSTNIEPNKAMKAYKDLQVVENAFDEIKNFLNVRGIYHRKPRRVRSHVFVCVLAFLLESIIEIFSEETARVVLRKLKRIKFVKLDLNGREKNLLTKIPKETESIFDDLKIPKPLVNQIKLF